MASRDVSKSWFLLAALLVGMGFLPAAPAVATDSSWSFYGGGQWSDPVNWSNGVPNGVDDVARFTVTVTNGARPFIDSTSPSGVTLGSLYISGDRYYVTYPSNSAAPSITFSTSGGPALFQADSGGVYCNVVLNAPLMFATNVSGASLMGVVSGSNSAYGITLTGSGNHGLSGANTYAGPTIIAQGTLIATDGVGLPTASNLVLAGGILRGPSGATFTRGLGTSPGLVHWTGSGGFGCWSGTYTVNLGGHATPDTVVWGQNGFVPDGSALMLSGADFRNPIDLAGGSREIFAEYTFSSTLSGAVSNGSLVKTGTGTLTFNAPSASTTLIDVTAGTLELKSNCSISGTVRVGPSGTLTVTSPNASVGTLLLQGGAVSYSGGVLSASTTFDLQKGDCSANLSGPGSLVKTTPDRVSLSGTNTYSGDTVLAEGRLYVGSAALSPNSNLVLKGGSLESSSPMTRSLGTGPGQVRWAGNVSLVSSSTTFTINLGGQTPATPLSWGQQYFIADGDPLMLNSTSAWGTVDFQNPIDLGSVNRTVQVVDGPYTSVTDIAILSGALTGAGGLVKTGNGTLSLTAANGYGGPTVISDGAVRAIDGTGLPAGSNLVLAGGALEGNGATSFVRGLGTDPGQVQWTGSGGFSAGGGKMSVNIGGQAAPITLTWGSGGFVPAGSEFLLGSRSSSGEVEFANPIDLAGALRTLRVEKNLYQNANDSASLIGPLSNGGLVKTGAGLLVLKGQNTFTGGAWVNAGTLRLAADSAIAGGCPVTVAGGTLDLQTFNVAAGTVTLLDGTISGTTGVLSATGYDLRKGTISGQIGGAAGVVKTTADTVILSGANSYAGLTTVSEGALQIKSAGALGSAAAGTVVLPGAALELYKASVTNESLTISGVGIGGAGALRAVNPYPQSEGSQGWLQGPITLAGNTTIGVECSNALVLNCPINDQGSGYGLKKVGTGPLQLLGANSYSGPTIIAGGSLTATDGVGLPTASNLALAGGTVLLTNGQTFTRAVGTDPGQVQWTTGGGVTAASGTATVNLGGHATPDALTWGAGGFVPDGSTLLLSATSGGTIVFQNPINLAGGDRAFVGGTLSGALSNGGVTVAGGVVTLNAANTYAGATRVKSGTLRVGRADAIPGNSPASVEGGATFDIGAYAVTAGPVTLVDGLITGTTGVLTSAADYDLRKGTVSAILGGTAGLTKTTADYVELRGANSYTGLTRILNGTLSINNNSALGTTDAGTVIEPSGTLNFNTSSITTSEPITVGGMGYNGMGALRSNGTFNGPITVTSHTCFDTGSGGGTTTFNGPITSPYDIRLTGGGTVVLANPANAITGRLEIGRGTLKLGAAMSGLQPAALSLFEESPGSGNGTPVFDMQLYSVTIGSLFLSSGTISGSSGAVLTASDAQLQSGRLSPSLAGTCGVTKTSANTVTLEGNNSYTGLTNVLEGTLKITHPNALGASSAGTRIAPGATLQPIFSSWGTIVAEPLTLGGAGVNGSGAIYLETYGVAFTGPVTLESDTTVRADKSTDVALPRIEFQGPVGGAGGLTKTGGGELDLCAAGTYAGPTTVAEGRLGVRNGAALGSTSTRATVASGACLSLEGNIAVGPKPLTISGEGYSRPYYPTQFTGALYADGGIHSWAGPVHMDGDGTIRVYGSMGSGGVLALTGGIEDGGSGYVLTKRGSGTLVLTGTGAWGGATVIQNGAIRATEGVGLPSTTNLRLSHLHTDGDFSDDNIPGVLEGNGPQTFSRSLGQLPGQVQWLDGGGFSAHGGKMTVNIGGQTTPTTLVWGVTPYFVPAYSSLALGSYTADSETEFRNPIDLGSTSRSIATYRDPKSSTALATLSGMLSGTGNILVGGNAVLFLAATNNYTGTTSIGSGAVRAVEGVGLPVASPLKFSGSGVYETVGTSTFTRGLGTTAGKVYWAGGGGFSAYGGKLTVNIGGNATPSSLTWDTTNFVPSGSPLWFGSPSSDSEVEFRNPINLNGKYTGFVVNDNPATVADFATLSGVLSNGSLEKWGLGTLVFSAANTYQGNTTIWEGALRAADGVGLPSASNLAFGYAGTGGPPGGTLEGSGATTFTRSMGTGAAMVRWSYSGGFSAYGGKMTVAIGGTSSPTPLVWGSGNFVPNNYALIFGSSTANSETEFKNSIDLAGAARTITVNDNPFSTGDFATLSGQISNGGLIKDGSGTLVLTGANTYEGTTTVKAGALRATIGAGLPAAGNLNLSGGVIESIGATTFTRNLGTSGSNTLQWTGSGGFSAGGGKMTVAVGGTGSPTPLVWGAGNFVPLGSTLMFGSPAADSETELKNGIDLAGGDRTVFVDDNPLSAGDFATISGVVSSTSAGLVKDGPGTLLLSGANTYTGATTVVAGALRAADGAGLPAASNLVLGGGVLEGRGAAAFVRGLGTSGAGTVQWTGSGGFSANGGKMTVAIGGLANPTPLRWNTTNFLPDQYALMFGSTTADSEVEFRNPLDLAGGSQWIAVEDNPASAFDFATVSGVISNGSFNKGGNGLLRLTAANTYTGYTILGAGVLRAVDGVGLPTASNLKFAGTSPGSVLEGEGSTLMLRGLGTGPGQVQWTGSGGFSACGGKMTVALGGTGSPTPLTWGSGGFVPSGSALVFGSTTADNETEFKNSIDFAGTARTITVNDNPTTTADFATISGTLSNGSLIKDGAGTLVLANSTNATGDTTVKAGALTVNAGTVATLNVPAGGTANLNSPARATAANVSGGQLNLNGTVTTLTLTGSGKVVTTGPIATAGTADFSAGTGTVNASTNPLIVTNMANFSGSKVTLTGGSSFKLSGSDVINPSTGNHRVITAAGGTLTITPPATSTVAIGAGSGTASYDSGTGVWSLTQSGTGGFDDDNSFFVYAQLPAGDLDFKLRAVSNPGSWAKVAVEARDGLVQSGSGVHYAQMYYGNIDNDWATRFQGNTTGGAGKNFDDQANKSTTPYWMELQKVGLTLSAYRSADGVTWTQVGSSHTYTAWGPYNYVGIAIDNSLGTNAGTFDNVPFPVGGMLDWSTTDVAVTATSVLSLPSGTTKLGCLSLTNASTQLALSGSGATGVSFDNISATDTSSIAAGVPISLRSGNVTVSGGKTLTVSTNIVSGTLNKLDTGTLTLSGANTHSGGTTLSAGTLTINNASALGTGTFTISGGTINNNSAAAVTLSTNNAQTWDGNFTFTGTQHLNLGTGAVSLGTAAGTTRTITASANTLTVGGVISDGTTATALTKAGGGTLMLSNANTYTGLTTVSPGTLTLAGSSGTIADTAPVTVTGGTLSVAYSDTVGAVTISGGTINGPGTLTGSSYNLTTGGVVNAPLAGVGVALTKSGANVSELNGTNTYTGGTTISSGTLRITSDAALGAVPGIPTVNVTLNGGILMNNNSAPTLDANRAISLGASGGSIQASWSRNITINGKTTGTGALTILSSSGWVILTNANDYSGTTKINSGGKLQLGNGGTTGSLSTSSSIVNNGTLAFKRSDTVTQGTAFGVISSGSGAVTQAGTGTLVFSLANAYTGATTISAGVLRANSGTGLPTASNVVLAGGVLESSEVGTFTRALGSGSNQVQWTGSGGFSAYGGKMTVAIGGAGSPTALVWGSGNFVPSGSALVFGSATADNETEFQNSIDLAGAARTITANDNPFSTADFATLSGTLSNGSLTKDGAGTLVLKGSHTYTGATTISGGTLKLASGATVASTTFDVRPGATFDVQALSGGFTLAPGRTLKGSGTVLGDLVAGGVVAPGSSPGILTVEDITFSSTGALQIELGGTARGTGYDALAASGTVTLQSGSSLAVTLINSYVPAMDDQFDILDFAGLSGEFSTVSLPALGSGLKWDASDLYTTGTTTVVPEPATLGLLAAGLGTIWLKRRRKA